MCLLVVTAGCGVQTEEANEALAKAAKPQQEAEEALARIKNFPAEWQAVFSIPAGPDQIARARQLLVNSEADIEALKSALAGWKAALQPIIELNVDDQIREYATLKISSIDCYSEYASDFLPPIFKAYEGLVEQIAYGRPQAEIDRTAKEITELVGESSERLRECVAAQKQADEFFNESGIGEQKD